MPIVDPTQIRFRVGQKQSFIAARTFALGSTGTTIPRGSEVLFDGTRVEVDGAEYALPQLRGAIRAGWLVPTDQFDEGDTSAEVPIRANVQVRHAAKGGNPMEPNRAPTHAMQTTESDEREVSGGSVSQRAASVRQRNTGYHRGQTVNGQVVRSQRGFETVEPQDGVEVEGRVLQTAAGDRAKYSRVEVTSETVGRHLANAARVQVQPGQGVTEDQMLENMPEEERELYLAEKAALRAQYVEEPEPAPRVIRRVKATPKTETHDGITLSSSSGGGVEIADPAFGGAARESMVVEDGISFRMTNGPKSTSAPQPPVDIASTLDVRRQIATAMCPDFPTNYIFDLPDRKKIARLAADYEDRPDVLRAVFAAEGDAFKAKLLDEFPQAFGR